MKEFRVGNERFTLSSYRVKAVPVGGDEAGAEEAGVSLARAVCEEACALSSDGGQQISLELLRIAGSSTGKPIEHVLTIRTHGSEHDCALRHKTAEEGMTALLHSAGYLFEELSYDEYRELLPEEAGAVWGLKREDIKEYGTMSNYRSPGIVESVDWAKVYDALNGSGCTLCIHSIPSRLTAGEHRRVVKSSARCSQAAGGLIPPFNDALAAAAAERWRHYADEAPRPFAEVNIVVAGKAKPAALLTARLKEAITGASFRAVPLSDYARGTVYNQPWRVSRALKEAGSERISKWTSAEAAKIFRLPVQSDYFLGVERNSFSLTPEVDLLSGELTGGNGSIALGTSVFTSQRIGLSPEQLLLHTAVTGKTGTGKTTMLKEMIRQLNERDIPVLILEPVKREYRDLIATLKNGRVFTVERQITPLRINPFDVPPGVALSEYRGALLSAFKAAFSLPDPLPSLFEKAITKAYRVHGWTDASRSGDSGVTTFDMADFIRIFKNIIAMSAYSAEVRGNILSGGAFRLLSLLERCPCTFDSLRSTSAEELLSGCTVLEMGDLEAEQKALVTALTLIRLLAYIKASRTSRHKLQNVILLDEAHALLDQGEGITEEEKALGSAMGQLLVNIVTELRAYGVGFIFSDQTPSRIGSRLLSNVENVLAFRLSGQEAAMLGETIGADEKYSSDVLPALDTGEFLLKNRFLREPLAVRMDRPGEMPLKHVTDRELAQMQAGYLSSHAKEYRPYALCESAGCRRCEESVRGAANVFAEQIFSARSMKLSKPDALAAHIIRIPACLSSRIPENGAAFQKLCGCAAVQLMRKCALEKDLSFGPQTAAAILGDMLARAKKGANHG